jgi:hypothetical protein
LIFKTPIPTFAFAEVALNLNFLYHILFHLLKGS